MRRWNGWGDINVNLELPAQGLRVLYDLIGEGRSRPDYPLEKFIERIPESRLDRHPLISSDPKLRLDHAHGQSLPDWIGLRGGTLQRFPDGVAFPATVGEIQELLSFALKATVGTIYGAGMWLTCLNTRICTRLNLIKNIPISKRCGSKPGFLMRNTTGYLSPLIRSNYTKSFIKIPAGKQSIHNKITQTNEPI